MINGISQEGVRPATREAPQPTNGSGALVREPASKASATRFEPAVRSALSPASTVVNGLSAQTQSTEQVQETQRQEIQQAVRQMNDYVQNIQRDISFSVDDDTGKTVISVKDSQSGELIRQIPREEVLEMAKSLQEAQGLLFKARV